MIYLDFENKPSTCSVCEEETHNIILGWKIFLCRTCALKFKSEEVIRFIIKAAMLINKGVTIKTKIKWIQLDDDTLLGMCGPIIYKIYAGVLYPYTLGLGTML